MGAKTILLVGKTDGIGRPTARKLAESGATFLLHDRLLGEHMRLDRAE